MIPGLPVGAGDTPLLSSPMVAGHWVQLISCTFVTSKLVFVPFAHRVLTNEMATWPSIKARHAIFFSRI